MKISKVLPLVILAAVVLLPLTLANAQDNIAESLSAWERLLQLFGRQPAAVTGAAGVVPAATVSGCVSGDMFSRTTGQLCTSAVSAPTNSVLTPTPIYTLPTPTTLVQQPTQQVNPRTAEPSSRNRVNLPAASVGQPTNPLLGIDMVTCSGSRIPTGVDEQTLYCDGITGQWTPNWNIWNNGYQVRIGEQRNFPPPPDTYFYVRDRWGAIAINGDSDNGGVGVFGNVWNDNPYSAGVLGHAVNGSAVRGNVFGGSEATGKAIEAISYGNYSPGVYGFYETGNAPNYFEGKLGFGTARNPAENIDLGGGNIKMGYEIVARVGDGMNLTVLCPNQKKVIGGGCECQSNCGDAQWQRYSSRPLDTGDGWKCSTSVGTDKATAICANIR